MPVDLNIISAGNDRFGWLQAVRNLQDQLSNPFIADNVPMMVQEMLNRCGNQRNSIRFVRIFGHGTPACQFIGTGDQIPQFETQKLGLDEATKNLFNQAAIARLGGYFIEGGSVVLHGCNVAAGTRGQLFLEKLAMLWQVSIAASQDTQSTELSGNLPISPLTGRIRHTLFNLPNHSPVRGRGFSISYNSVQSIPETLLQQ